MSHAASRGMGAARLALRQVEGVAAQVALGAPSLLASFVLARWSALSLVSDLAVAFGVASALATAAWFNLSHALALWGLNEQTEEDFWCNRILASLAAVAVTVVVLLALGIAWPIVLLAVLVKLADATADLRLGFDLLHGTADGAMRRLLAWSLVRLGAFVLPVAGALALGAEGARALLAGAVVQLLVMSVRDPAPIPAFTRARLAAAWRLARRTAHLSVAATASGLMVTAPRIVSREIVPPDEVGYYAVTFVACTFVGMAFTVTWYRLAAATRQDGAAAALRAFARQGGALALAMAAGLWLASPLVAAIYGISDPRFTRIFTIVGSAFVLLYLVQCAANLLKMARGRFLESAAYLSAAAALAVVALASGGLVPGVLAAAATLAAIVAVGLQEVRRAAVAR